MKSSDELWGTGRASEEGAHLVATDRVAVHRVTDATAVTAQCVRLGLEACALRPPPSDVWANRLTQRHASPSGSKSAT